MFLLEEGPGIEVVDALTLKTALDGKLARLGLPEEATPR